MPVRQGTMTGKDTTLARSQHMKRKVKLKQKSKSHAGNKGQLQKKVHIDVFSSSAEESCDSE